MFRGPRNRLCAKAHHESDWWESHSPLEALAMLLGRVSGSGSHRKRFLERSVSLTEHLRSTL